MDFKRALVGPQKGIFCKSIGRLFEAKRASFKTEGVKNNYKSKAKTTKNPFPNGKGYDYCDISIKKIRKRESAFYPKSVIRA